MDYSKFINVVFAGEEIEKPFTSVINTEKNIGVTTMIPSLSAIAYILNLKYDDLKNFFKTHECECKRYEKMFTDDYNKCRNIMWYLTRDDKYIEKLKEIDPTGIFYYNTEWRNMDLTKFTDYHIKKIINNENIIRQLGKRARMPIQLNYDIEFISGLILKGFESNHPDECDEEYRIRCEKVINDIRNYITSIKHSDKGIYDITFNCTPTGTVTSTIHIRPKFDNIKLLDFLDRMRKGSIAKIKRNKTI